MAVKPNVESETASLSMPPAMVVVFGLVKAQQGCAKGDSRRFVPVLADELDYRRTLWIGRPCRPEHD
jgi:hypothetical protein